LFARAISARTLQLSKKASKQVTFPLQDKPVFEALLDAPWESLAAASSIDDATQLRIPVAQVLEASPVGNTRGFVLRWKTSCPCCFNELIPEPKVGVTEEEFANLAPEVTKETVILRDCPVLDDSTGEEVRKTIMVHVVTVKPVVSTATAFKFKFRSCDGDEHRGYKVVIPPMPTVASHDGMNEVDEVWQLVRTSESDSSALSFIRIGCLDSLFGEQTNPKSNLAAARRIDTLLRRAAPYRELNSRKAPATVDAAIDKKGLRASSLRVNRVGGPNGHAGGFFLQEVKAKVCSPFISHCIPRNPVGSVITWPMASGDCITEIIPFYLSVKMDKGLAVTCPPHCAIPRHGYVSRGTRVLDEFQKDQDKRLLEFLRIFTATVYSGARILRQLGMCFPHLMTSEEAVLRTLRSEESRRAIHSAGVLPPSSATRSRTAGERDSYYPGQAVFVTDSNPDSDATWPALVVELARSTGKHFLVKLVGDTDESPPFEIPRSRLLPDTFGDVLDRGDDDDVVRASFAANDTSW
jgi:hypothetical protein